MSDASERERRRWWLLRRRPTPASPAQAALERRRIMDAVEREGQLGEHPAAFYLTLGE
ncbi:hypothetical protein ACTI_15310 [Actinoplanes sp. OR16]|uniref:hypothetical protein n=1 Tax=Actinoplanes sp. OR16 TaxID=946334 RepID=UPI000F710864|nr:hypothetical protein [Actinoplanes sp. OR16]BBH64846.1 hypothetical protein ACTI_15310 [Actinoplanes sp. OR16]